MPNQGSLLVNKNVVLPKVSMKIIDLSDHEETRDVQLGQNLEFILSVDPPDGNLFNFNFHSSSNSQSLPDFVLSCQVLSQHLC